MSERPNTKTWRYAYGATSAGVLLGAMIFLAMALMPGLAIILTVLGLNLLGDGMRDYFDPKLRVSRI